MFNRRMFLLGVASLPLPSIFKPNIPYNNRELEIEFYDGEVCSILLMNSKVVYNSLGHSIFAINLDYNIENILDFKPKGEEIVYLGYNSFNELVYTNVGNKCIWRSTELA